MPMIKFPLLLWALSLLMKKAARNNPDFRKQLKGKDFAFQLQTADGGIVRQFVVANNSIRCKRKAHSNPAFTISCKNDDTAPRILTSNDKNAVMRSIQHKAIAISEDLSQELFAP